MRCKNNWSLGNTALVQDSDVTSEETEAQGEEVSVSAPSFCAPSEAELWLDLGCGFGLSTFNLGSPGESSSGQSRMNWLWCIGNHLCWKCMSRLPASVQWKKISSFSGKKVLAGLLQSWFRHPCSPFKSGREEKRGYWAGSSLNQSHFLKLTKPPIPDLFLIKTQSRNLHTKQLTALYLCPLLSNSCFKMPLWSANLCPPLDGGLLVPIT